MTGCGWEPQAYPGVPLHCHNASVGAGAYAVAADRVEASRLLTAPLDAAAGGGSLLASTVLAGALHDLGKASPHYRGRGSYYGHELAGAAVIYNASRIARARGDRALQTRLLLAAWAVARHHAAMRDRHPSSPSESLVREASRALEALAREPECLPEALPGPLRGSGLESLLLESLEDLRGRAGRLLWGSILA
ncbi:MAG: HD domain-containing protein, partial [Desulfurococcales archaeon]|nr:HD domain-containing protein [Desulfurococcales archaeon]